MFDVGDFVINGKNGVCRVVEIGHLNISSIDQKKLYYTLQPVYTKGSTVYTPVDNHKVVVRKIISKEKALELIDDIPNIEMFWFENDKLRDEKFKESMKKFDCREWIKIIKSLYINKQDRISKGKKLASSDERYLQTAEDCLYGELAIPLNIPKDQMESFIVSRLELIYE